jgi:transcription antitermination factor NusA-like protein
MWQYIVMVATVVIAAWTVDARYAKCEDLLKVEKRLEIKILDDVKRNAMQRQWEIELRYPEPRKRPELVNKIFNDTVKEIADTDSKMKAIMSNANNR